MCCGDEIEIDLEGMTPHLKWVSKGGFLFSEMWNKEEGEEWGVFGECHDISFPGLLWQMATNLVAWTSEIYSLTRGQKSRINVPGLQSRCRQSHTPSGGATGEWVRCLFQLRVAACVPWLVAAPPVSDLVVTWKNGAPLFSYHSDPGWLEFGKPEAVGMITVISHWMTGTCVMLYQALYLCYSIYSFKNSV